MTPAAEALVEERRAEHDWRAAHGIGAHFGPHLPATVAGIELRVAERTAAGGLAWVVVATAERG
jgi:hypothetical protein